MSFATLQRESRWSENIYAYLAAGKRSNGSDLRIFAPIDRHRCRRRLIERRVSGRCSLRGGGRQGGERVEDPQRYKLDVQRRDSKIDTARCLRYEKSHQTTGPERTSLQLLLLQASRLRAAVLVERAAIELRRVFGRYSNRSVDRTIF